MLIISPVKAAALSSATPSEPALSLPGCPDKCGDVTIPYPFGIGDGCAATSRNPSFAVTCNNTFQPPRPMIYAPASNTSTPMEVIDISLEHGEVSIYAPVGYSCFEPNTNTLDNYTGEFSLEGTPLILSSTRNRFMAIGCSALGLIGASDPEFSVAGCFSYCEGINQTSDGAPCSGKGCCETAISPNLTAFQAAVANVTLLPSFNPCIYAMLVQVGWYSFRRQDLVGHLGFVNERASRGVPVISDWAIRNGSCPKEGRVVPQDYACISTNSYCTNASNGPGYLCSCSKGYKGNPYLREGCQDINECEMRNQDPKYSALYPCKKGVCINTPGSYICRCRIGTKSDGRNSGCQPVLRQSEQVIIGKN